MRGASLAAKSRSNRMAAAKRGLSPRPGVLDIAPYVPGTSALVEPYDLEQVSAALAASSIQPFQR